MPARLQPTTLDTLATVRLLAILPLLFAATLAAQAPDTIYFHGDILTGVGLHASGPSMPQHVAALAITDGKITATGTDAAVLRLADKHTEKIDLRGGFAMPGFNDAHTHTASAGQQRLSVDLDGTKSLAEMLQRIRDYTAQAAPGTWILGGGWDHTKWPSKTLPTRQDLDAVTAGHPAFLARTDGHIAVANTAGLAVAGVTAGTPDPSGGKFDHDAKGELTGIVRESPARALVEAHIPPPSPAVRRQALTIALDDAISHGVTSVQDYSDWDDFLALEAMERDGQLHVRVSEWLTFNDPVALLKEHQAHHPVDDPMLHTGMLKGFMDGSLGSRTAAMNAPYSDDAGNSGLPRYDQKTLNTMTAERAAAGFQIGFHAIGDRANIMALDAFAAAEESRAGKTEQTIEKFVPNIRVMPPAAPAAADTTRFRIEHAQVLAPGDFDRFAKLHIIASMQPVHLLTDMAWATDRIGPERAKYAYAWKSMLDHGVTLAFGTDYPVESIDPFRGLYSAITRQNEAGTQTFQPQEKITLNEAIYAYTQGSAFAQYAEKKKGLLEPGFFADLIVLDRDITKASPQELLHTRVLRTVVGGQTVYTAVRAAAITTDDAATPHRNVPDLD
jgi:predicted amidohydrolase YtcJ